jgi:hypothetical protein
MSSIGNVEKNHVLLTENARRKADREIKHIENLHQKTKAELKKGQDVELQETREGHRLQLAQEAQKKEKILQDLKSHLEHTKSVTDKELKALDAENLNKKQKLKENFLLTRDQTNASHEAFLEDLNERFNQKSQDIREDGKQRIEEMKGSMSEEISDLEKKHRERLDNDRETFGQEYRSTEQNQKKLRDQQNLQFKTERMATNLNQSSQLNKMTMNHRDQLEVRDQEFRKGLKEQDLFFEKKFTDQISRHESSFKDLENKNKMVVEKLKDSLTKEIAVSVNRSEDPFYQFEKLNPKLNHLEDGVEIQVRVPEYAKQDLQLSINGKEAIVNFNRRYHDASKSEDGTINKINKVESFTSRLMTQYHLDPKSLKSRYQDGMMTFTIKKA